MLLTKEFLTEVNSCLEGYRFGLENNLIGGDYDAAITFCLENGRKDFADWLSEQKRTEYYVKLNGGTISMGAYQVFNPLTGVHTRYETEAEARQALIDMAKLVLDTHKLIVVREMSNEHGDTTWIPTSMPDTLVIS